jgi:hypothetical protein
VAHSCHPDLDGYLSWWWLITAPANSNFGSVA